MKLKYEGFKAFDLNHGVTVIATNNPKVFNDLTSGIRFASDLIELYDDDYSKKDVNKIFDIDTNCLVERDLNKKYQLYFINKLVESFSDSQLVDFNMKINDTYAFVQEKLFNFITPLEVHNRGEIKKYLKFMDIHISELFLDSPYDIIEADIKLHNEFNINNKVIVYENIYNFLYKEEFLEVVNLVDDFKSKLLLIEFTEIEKLKYYENCDIYYIDQDFVDFCIQK